MKHAFLWLGLALTLLLLAGCDKTFSDKSSVLVKVNGEAITEDAYQNYRQILQRQQHAAIDDNDQNRRLLLEQMVFNRLMAQEAEHQKLQMEPEVHYTIQLQRDEVLIGAVARNYLKSNPISADDIKKRYQELKQTNEYLVDHILVNNEKEAQEILAKAKSGKSSFAALAAKYSTHDQSRKKGGRIDWINSEFIVPSIYKAADQLKKPGLVNEPVKSKYGWHIVKVVKVRPAKVPPLEAIQQEIVGQLQREKINELAHFLRTGGKVEYVGKQKATKKS